MSQVAVMGLGEASGYAIYEHHSEAKAWRVTVVKPAEAVFDYFEPCSEAYCRYKPTEQIDIAKNRVKNAGNFEGTINIKFEELDADGNPLPGGAVCADSMSVSPGDYCALSYYEYSGLCSIGSVTETGWGHIVLNPRPTGIYYFGIKTWSEDESEPPYPSPTAALGGAEVLPVAGGEGIGLAIPVTVVSGVALVGLTMLARKKRLF